MPQRLRTTDKVRLDPLNALKRAFLHRGVVVGNQSPTKNSKSKTQKADAKPNNNVGNDSEPATTQLVEAPESQESHEKLIDITEKAQDILFEANTVFPFTLFPDTITLDREKLTVATRSFFKVAKIVSVPVSSISSAEVDIGPFFGSLHMASKFFVQNTYSVNFLTRSDAAGLHKLLQGYIIAHERNIDVTDIDKEDLLLLLRDLGQGVSD